MHNPQELPEHLSALPLMLLVRFSEATNEEFADRYYVLRQRLKEGESPTEIKSAYDATTTDEHNFIIGQLKTVDADLERIKHRCLFKLFDLENDDVLPYLTKVQSSIRATIKDRIASFREGVPCLQN